MSIQRAVGFRTIQNFLVSFDQRLRHPTYNSSYSCRYKQAHQPSPLQISPKPPCRNKDCACSAAVHISSPSFVSKSNSFFFRQPRHPHPLCAALLAQPPIHPLCGVRFFPLIPHPTLHPLRISCLIGETLHRQRNARCSRCNILRRRHHSRRGPLSSRSLGLNPRHQSRVPRPSSHHFFFGQ